jgi:hypothetical protein
MKLYCQECFAKIEYKFSKPKFCPECGKQIGLSKSVGLTSSGSIQIVQKNKDEQKIKDLESELQELKNKNRVSQSKKNLTAALSSDMEDGQSHNEFDSEEEEEEEEEEDADNYAQRQNILTAFKRGKFKTGVTVEKNTNNSGISFKDLMDGVSSGYISAGDDFKMSDDGVRKSDKQILEELRLEASSKPRVIQID